MDIKTTVTMKNRPMSDPDHFSKTQHNTNQRDEDRQIDVVSQLLTYWQSLRDLGQTPTRSDLDPRGFLEALPYSFVAARGSATDAHLRIVGSRVSDACGVDMRGHLISDMFAPSERGRFGMKLVQLFEVGEPVRMTLHSNGPRTNDMSLEMLLLPLKREKRGMQCLLGCVQPAQSEFTIRADLSFAQSRLGVWGNNVSGDLGNPHRTTRHVPYLRLVHQTKKGGEMPPFSNT